MKATAPMLNASRSRSLATRARARRAAEAMVIHRNGPPCKIAQAAQAKHSLTALLDTAVAIAAANTIAAAIATAAGSHRQIKLLVEIAII